MDEGHNLLRIRLTEKNCQLVKVVDANVAVTVTVDVVKEIKNEQFRIKQIVEGGAERLDVVEEVILRVCLLEEKRWMD